MTTTRYFIARLAQAFGIFRRSQRMGEAASEMHLLREAETQLGMAVWENVASIEHLSIEYWNLRKLVSDRADVLEHLAKCEKQLETAHAERSTFLNTSPPMQQGLLDQRLAVLVKLEELSRQRDDIVAQARDIRRIHDGLKIKLEFLNNARDSPTPPTADIEQVKLRLAELRLQFVNLKDERTRVGSEIDATDEQLDRLEAELEIIKKAGYAQASRAFQAIGEANKELSTLRAELGVLDTRMSQLYGEIGRYVSRKAFTDAYCAKTVKAHHGLLDVMRALRRSVALNHRLTGMS
jgi:chromosome segregation ATPase